MYLTRFKTEAGECLVVNPREVSTVYPGVDLETVIITMTNGDRYCVRETMNTIYSDLNGAIK